MSRVFLVLATLLAISSGASLDGQATRPIESELVDRIDSLSVVQRRAIDEADVADAVRKEEHRGLLTARIDTFQVGPFSVVARKREVGLARRYFGRAWARYAATVGAKRTSLEGHVFIFGKGKALLGLDSQGSTRGEYRLHVQGSGLCVQSHPWRRAGRRPTRRSEDMGGEVLHQGRSDA